jgi:predicted lipoprotein with Yx(FWY)xxD motif
MAIVAVVAVALAGIAMARSNTLSVAKGAKVTNTKMVTTTETVAVNSKGRVVYELVPETIHHPLCLTTNMCLKFWFPVTVPNASTKPVVAKGIKGKLGIWHRNGFFQVTLAGHPLYTFKFDTAKDNATGEGIKSFHGTWHVITASGTSTSKTTSAPSPPPMSPVAGPPGY